MDGLPNAFTLVDLLCYRADHQPDKRAYTLLVDGELDEVHITYKQLDFQARAIATKLQKLDCQDKRVMLLYLSSIEYITAFFGCLYAGAVPVPAFPPRLNRPTPRIQAIADDSKATIALTSPSILSNMQKRLRHTPALSTLSWLGISYPELDVDVDGWQQPFLSGDSLAYIQYTSGSTASPKGVMLNHKNVFQNMSQIQERLGLNSNDLGVLWGPLFHDLGLVFGILLALMVDFPLIFMPPISFVQKPLRWLQAISRYGGTISGGPNFGYQLCVDRISVDQRATLDLSSWKIALSGAEPIRSETLDQFTEAFSPYGFRHEYFCPAYGLAEATLVVSMQHRESGPTTICLQRSNLEQNLVVEDPEDNDSYQNCVSCGPPLPGLDIAIVDPDTLSRCPPNRVGEIWVSGPSIAQGYWKRPEETEKTFHGELPDAEGKFFLRTGDLGFLKDGMLFVTGRLKNLIIIRGSNYYPHDIELTAQRSHLALQPDGGAAFSVMIDGEDQLVVVHELKPTHRTANLEDVARAIRIAIAEEQELPVYAVVLVRSKTIPRSSSGKIQHNLCRSLFLADQLQTIGVSTLEDRYHAELDSDQKSFFAPQTPVEEALAEIWTQTLKVEIIYLDDNFFELGGQSLLATVVISHLKERFNLDLPLRSIFDHPTIREMADLIEARLGETQLSPLPALVPISREGPLKLSYAQERIWFLHQLNPDNSAYSIPGAIRLNGQLDWQVLERCYHTLLQRHESLRTTFSIVDGQPVQIIKPFSKPEIKIIDLRDLPEDQREKQSIVAAEQEASKPFDLQKGPLIRICVIRLADDDQLLVYNLHHIICDAWAIAFLERELVSLYNAYSSGESLYLPEPRIQYIDFAAWQRQWLQKEVHDSQMKYWRNKLSDAPILELPSDFPRSAVMTFRGAYEGFDLSRTLLDELMVLSLREGVTLFMLLMAAFKVLLYRYTGQTDITICVPIANRNWQATEPLIGTLVNTLLMRTDLSGNPSFCQLLQRVREVSLEAYSNQDIPFAKLVADLQPERDLSHQPLAQIMFNVVETETSPLDLKGLNANILEINRYGSQFDLTLSITNTNIMRRVDIEYNTDLFRSDTISRMLQHYRVILENILADPTQKISSLPIITGVEREQLLVTWNDTKTEYPQHANIVELFEEQVVRTRDAPAYIFESDILSFQDLNERANRLANYLQFQGVKTGDTVCLYIERSLEMTIAVMGILKAGGVFLPLELNYPHERLTYMLKDADSEVVITQEKLAPHISASDTNIICLDADSERIARQSAQNPTCLLNPNSPAYVLYTSGSTGKPKGVLGTHQGAINRFAWMWQTYPFNKGEVCCQKTSLSFVDSIWELFGPLLQGIPTVIIPGIVVRDTEQFVNVLAENNITRIVLVPSQLRAILDAYPDLQRWLPKLQTWVCSGETLPVALVQAFREAKPNAILLNLYGSTEVAADVTFYDTAFLEAESTSVPIGRPIANTSIYLLDANRNPVPIGITAEVYIGGAGLALGYLNSPELTPEKFITDPFNDDPSARLYRSGDIARYLPDGNIEFIGRRDSQVKIRGYRVELREIETVLNQHPAIKQTAVMYVPDHLGDVRTSKGSADTLVAYIVTQEDTSPTVNELRDMLKVELPAYMIPAMFVQVEDIPLTTSGKIDRMALMDQSIANLERGTEFEPARDAIEYQLVQIWEEVLEVQPIGLQDDFFSLGGHSLLAVRLFFKIEEVLGVKLPIATIFHAPTIAQLAEAIRQEGYSIEWFSLAPLQTEGSKPPLFLVHGFGGGVLGYGELVRLLGTDQPVYGLPARGYDDGKQPHTSIVEMATEYIRVLRTVQPTGPYFLAGYSYGGVVAYEVAQQLQAQGEQTAFLAILVGYAPNSDKPKFHVRNAVLFVKNFWFWLKDYFARQGMKDQFLRTLARIKMASQILIRKDNQPDPKTTVENIIGDTSDLSEQELTLMEAQIQAVMAYKPEVYPGQVTLFRVQTLALSHWNDPELGWGPLAAGGLEIRQVPGAHYNILEHPNVEVVAEQLRECLSAAQINR